MSEPSTPAPAGDTPERRSFGTTYWLCNVIEMWERLAYYVLRPVAPIYICQATEPGGLHLPQATKGWIYMWWAIFQSFLPMATGGLADRYGYKRIIFFSVSMNIAGYLLRACKEPLPTSSARRIPRLAGASSTGWSTSGH